MRDFVNVVAHSAHRDHLADMLTQVRNFFRFLLGIRMMDKSGTGLDLIICFDEQ